MPGWRRATLLATAAALALCPAAGAQAFDPELEAKNYAKLKERTAYLTGTPEFQTRLQQQNVADSVDYPLIGVRDPERNPYPKICANRRTSARATCASTTGPTAATA